MKFTLSWLKEFLETDKKPLEIADKLTEIGFELEEIINHEENLKYFTIAKIIESSPHADSDTLNLCKVDSGSGILDIVCGAHNAKAGKFVVLAPVGSIIPTNGMKIKKSKIRGAESHGMLCSSRELGIGDDHDGIIELNVNDELIGKSFVENSEFGDVIFDVAVTPNRGDCLGVYGLARELAAVGFGELIKIENTEITGDFDSDVKVEIMSDKCSLMTIREIKNVKNIQSPEWLKKRLEMVGLKSISSIVDITNYVCHSFARPLHAYDSNLTGSLIKVDHSKDSQKFEALNDEEYVLNSNDLVLMGSEGEILSLAGIIGGKSSACSHNTNGIYLESAAFSPTSVASTGRNHKIITDSRFRFERSVDEHEAEMFSNFAAKMILDICGGSASKIKVVGNLPEKRSISFEIDVIEKVTSVKISEEKISEILSNLGFVVDISGSQLSLEIPTWRKDISIKEDIIEEVIRIYGFNHIQEAHMWPKNISDFQILSKKQRNLSESRRLIAQRGFTEMISWSFMSSKKARIFTEISEALIIKNPISSDLDLMRPLILPNLIDIVHSNFNHGVKNVSIFEIGPIYKNSDFDGQIEQICGVRAGKSSRKTMHGTLRDFDLFDVKSDAYSVISQHGFDVSKLKISVDDAPNYYHSGRKAALKLGKNIIGYFGQIHPVILKNLGMKFENVCAFEIFPSLLPESRGKKGKKSAFEPSKFQSIVRDFAFSISSEVKSEEIIRHAKSVDPMIEDVHLFDFYERDGEATSIAIEVVIQSNDKTLTDQEIDDLSTKIISTIELKTSAKFNKA